jgi:hypothetical protein
MKSAPRSFETLEFRILNHRVEIVVDRLIQFSDALIDGADDVRRVAADCDLPVIHLLNQFQDCIHHLDSLFRRWLRITNHLDAA